MPLTNLNSLDPSTTYLVERNNLLKRWENDPLFQNSQNNTVTQQDLSAHQDIRRFIAIGYGLDLLHNSPQAIAGYFVAANIQLPGHSSVGLSAADLQLIIEYQADPFNPNKISALLNGFPSLTSESDATALLNARASAAENQLDQILGFHMAESKERAVLSSLSYNNASALLGPKRRIKTLAFQQLVMAARFHQLALLKHHHLVRQFRTAEPVRHADHQPGFGKA